MLQNISSALASSTCPPLQRGVMPEIHDRMPVIVPPENYLKWLDPASRYRDLLEPDADALELVPVSSLVNNVKNDSPACAERVV